MSKVDESTLETYNSDISGVFLLLLNPLVYLFLVLQPDLLLLSVTPVLHTGT